MKLKFPQSRQRGMSLFELMIAVAIVGVLSAIAVPAYRSYIDTAAMTRVASNFEQGIKVAQAEFTKVKARAALGLIVTVPNTTEGWVEILNSSGVQAPGGGPAYIPSTNKNEGKGKKGKGGGKGGGDEDTGGIGVEWDENEQRLRLWRPNYLDLREMRADVTASGVEIEKGKP